MFLVLQPAWKHWWSCKIPRFHTPAPCVPNGALTVAAMFGQYLKGWCGRNYHRYGHGLDVIICHLITRYGKLIVPVGRVSAITCRRPWAVEIRQQIKSGWDKGVHSEMTGEIWRSLNSLLGLLRMHNGRLGLFCPASANLWHDSGEFRRSQE